MADTLTTRQRIRRLERKLDAILSRIESGLGSITERLDDAVRDISDLKSEAPVCGLDRIEEMVRDLHGQRVVKEWYTVAEVAEMLDRSEYTVSEWCSHGRMRAERAATGQGRHKPWRISHEELRRYQREGLLPARQEAVLS